MVPLLRSPSALAAPCACTRLLSTAPVRDERGGGAAAAGDTSGGGGEAGEAIQISSTVTTSTLTPSTALAAAVLLPPVPVMSGRSRAPTSVRLRGDEAALEAPSSMELPSRLSLMVLVTITEPGRTAIEMKRLGMAR